MAVGMNRMPEDRFAELDLKHKPTTNIYWELEGIIVATLRGRFSEHCGSNLIGKDRKRWKKPL
jgi:hypothetical protein